MLKHRIIPVVLIDGYSVVKTIKFDERRNLGNPITVAKTYNSRNVDELIILDIDASKDQRTIDINTISEIASECFMPLTIGGGIKNLEDIRQVLKKGADKVSINSAAIENPNLIAEASKIFGVQCIVVSIDVIEVENKYHVYSNGNVLDLDPIKWIQEAIKLGAGEILINSVNQDGEMLGPNTKLIETLEPYITVPFVYIGGVAKPEDCVTVIKSGADASAAASIFHFTRWTPESCSIELNKNNLPARIPN